MEKEVKEFEKAVKQANTADVAQDTRGWWELGSWPWNSVASSSSWNSPFSHWYMPGRSKAAAAAFSTGYWRLPLINPGMGCFWAMMVFSSWLQQAGMDTATSS